MLKGLPETVNGYIIIAALHTPRERSTRAGYVILGYHEERETYVTAWLGMGSEQWSSGHYITDRDEATKDFAARCIRSY